MARKTANADTVEESICCAESACCEWVTFRRRGTARRPASPVLIVSVSLSVVLNGDVARSATRPGFAGLVPPAGLEPAPYRLEGVPGRALCNVQQYQGFVGPRHELWSDN